MLTTRKLGLNLASNPLRNRRLFFWLTTVLGIILIIVTFLAVNLFFNYRWKLRGEKASMANTLQKIRIAQRKEKEFTERSKQAIEKYKERIDLVNRIILRKSFSWVKFLADLENSLPDSSYIISLAPKLIEDSRMEVRFKVASQNLNMLLELINNLKALEFKGIRVESETKNKKGFLISAISLNYERNI